MDGHPEPGTDKPDTDGESAGQDAETRAPASETTGKSRLTYVDPGGSQSTRELRDTARRRRDAEEKLQQHLMEAKEHAHQHEADHRDDQDTDDQDPVDQDTDDRAADGQDTDEQDADNQDPDDQDADNQDRDKRDTEERRSDAAPDGGPS